jgi:transposase
MRRRRLKKLLKRLHELQHQRLTRDELLLKLGAAKKEAGRAYALLDIHVSEKDQAVTPETFTFSLNRAKLRLTRRREGHYLLRSNLSGEDPAKLWQYYIQLTEVEQAFKELKNELSIRPIFHQKEARIEAHIFVAFVA